MLKLYLLVKEEIPHLIHFLESPEMNFGKKNYFEQLKKKVVGVARQIIIF